MHAWNGSYKKLRNYDLSNNYTWKYSNITNNYNI